MIQTHFHVILSLCGGKKKVSNQPCAATSLTDTCPRDVTRCYPKHPVQVRQWKPGVHNTKICAIRYIRTVISIHKYCGICYIPECHINTTSQQWHEGTGTYINTDTLCITKLYPQVNESSLTPGLSLYVAFPQCYTQTLFNIFLGIIKL